MEKKVKQVKNKTVKRGNKLSEKWFLLNAQGKILGKVAATAAKVLLAKADPSLRSFQTPEWRVVIINASKVAVTGRKEEQKKYYRYSGYPGGLKEINLGKLREEKPAEIITHAVYGMLPKNRRGKAIRKHLFVYSSNSHPHEAQKMEDLEI
jgi:large subunit ribosomal protein L13